MLNTFQNAERHHFRRTEREQHLKAIEAIIANPGNIVEEMENLTPAVADSLVGEPLTPITEYHHTSPRRRNIAGILVVASAAIVVLLAASIGRFSSNVPNKVAEKSIPYGDGSLRRYDHLFNMILDWEVTLRSVLEDPASSPHQALVWLSNEDTLETSNVETIRSRYALATFYYSNKASWVSDTHWMTSYPVCLWYGVECMGNDEVAGLVQTLNLTNNGLIGTIPTEIGLLKRHIKILDLSANSIQGTIPDLSMLENLNKLYLGSNSLSGEIPESIYELSHLTHFYAEDCKLSGKIDSRIGKLSNLQGLGLHKNRLSGSIPPTIDQLTDLRALYLDSNSLDGSIPAAVGDLTRLLDLRLRGNQLTGSIPASISKILLLQILYLDTNQLTGKIPALSDLTLMRELHLYDNAITGPIPTSIGSLPLLTILYLVCAKKIVMHLLMAYCFRTRTNCRTTFQQNLLVFTTCKICICTKTTSRDQFRVLLVLSTFCSPYDWTQMH